ncbi:hypothetical protein [Nocardia pseudobrasiliensis]|uniref:Ig-like domain-containing protein n=1 Tax=Nocardia pseudobrasiliensis TaxID=45979 RepID=A0A370I4D3_9NOCA|nr:hypothetical protein [Nocardia pseudobrasiliensis]RDI65460.1 hypothetical protein DFR76_106332 [Nocardia pseudobrasiliensis]
MITASRIASGAVAAGALVAAAVLAAPVAVADTSITKVEVAPGLSFGSSTAYGTGCSYKVTAFAPPDDAIMFTDETDSGATTRTLSPSYLATDTDGRSTVTWTPTEKGKHRIRVQENHPGATSVVTTVTVGTGIALGPVCLVLP